MKKNEARTKARARKALLSESERQQAASIVFEQIEQLAPFMMAQHILIYHSLPDELSTLRFLGKWNLKKQFFLPRVNGVNLDILPYDKSTLKLGAFHIEEPQGNEVTPLEQIDLIIVPAIAFDNKGNRVGRGRGYYDRLLAGTPAIKVGVAFDCQIVDDIEVDPYDQPVDIIITERRIIRRALQRDTK